MKNIRLTYSGYINTVVDDKGIYEDMQHTLEYIGIDKYYHLFTIDDIICYESFINSVVNSGEVEDYETKYADTANRILGGESFRSNKFARKYDSSSTEVTESCSDSSWTLFHDINFGSEVKYFSELVYKCSNLDKIRVRIDDDEVTLQAAINSLKKVIVDDDGIVMKDIDVSYVNNIATVYMDLNYQKGSRIRILQQKRNGTGDLTSKGYLLSYVERK